MSCWTSDKLFSSASVEWATPQWLFDQIDEEFNIVLDASATAQNAKCPQFLTPEQDALSCEWGPMAPGGGSIWLNPPWGRGVGEWVKKAYDQSSAHKATVVCLLPSNTDTRWWHDYVMRAYEVRFIKGRLKFIRSDGHTGPCPKGAAIVVFDCDPPTFGQQASLGPVTRNRTPRTEPEFSTF